MKRVFFSVVFLFLGLSISFSSYAQEKKSEDKKTVVEEKSNDQSKSSDNKVFNTICPVSTEDADQEITYAYNGKTYAVCCENCLKKFKKDPEKYISRLSEDGKSIKKK